MSRKPRPLDRYPRHPVGTWEHALVLQVAGHPVPPESMAALAEHDRMPGKSDGCREVYVHRAEVRVAAAEYVRTAGGVLDLDTLTETMTGDGHPLAGEVPRALLAQCPMSLEPDTDPDVDRVRPVGPSFCGWYDHQGTVYVATTIRALRSVVQAEEEAERRRERARKKRERRRAREEREMERAEREAEKRRARRAREAEDARRRAAREQRLVLTAEVVNTCRRRAAAGEPVTALAREYDVNAETMASAVAGETWANAAAPPVPRVPNRTAEQWHAIVAAAGDMIDSGATLTGAARRLGVSRRSLAAHMHAEGVTDGLPSTPAPRHPMGVITC